MLFVQHVLAHAYALGSHAFAPLNKDCYAKTTGTVK